MDKKKIKIMNKHLDASHLGDSEKLKRYQEMALASLGALQTAIKLI